MLALSQPLAGTPPRLSLSPSLCLTHCPPHPALRCPAPLLPLYLPQLEGWEVGCLFFSPLKRAAQTAELVWGGRPGATQQLACLREIDLYSFQVTRLAGWLPLVSTAAAGKRGTVHAAAPGPAAWHSMQARMHGMPLPLPLFAFSTAVLMAAAPPDRGWTRLRTGSSTPSSTTCGRTTPPSL